MQFAVASACNYAVLTFAVDDAGAIIVPVGIALWSPERHWVGLRLVEKGEQLLQFISQKHYPFVSLVQENIKQWMATKKLPYSTHFCEPYETDWWKHTKELLIHKIRISEPRPIDCSDPEQEIGPLFEAVVSPNRSVKEQKTRINGEITKCLNDLEKKYKSKQELQGYGGRKVRVLRSYDGPNSIVVIEGVNLASNEAELQTDAVVSKLLRVKEVSPKKIDLIIGYLTSPGGLNGEKTLVDWIEHRTGAKAFDLMKQRREFRVEAGNLVAQATVVSSD